MQKIRDSVLYSRIVNKRTSVFCPTSLEPTVTHVAIDPVLDLALRNQRSFEESLSEMPACDVGEVVSDNPTWDRYERNADQ